MPYLSILIGLLVYYHKYGVALPTDTSMNLIVSSAFVVAGLIAILNRIGYRK